MPGHGPSGGIVVTANTGYCASSLSATAFLPRDRATASSLCAVFTRSLVRSAAAIRVPICNTAYKTSGIGKNKKKKKSVQKPMADFGGRRKPFKLGHGLATIRKTMVGLPRGTVNTVIVCTILLYVRLRNESGGSIHGL